MRKFEGFTKGINLGGWLSQHELTQEHLDTFISKSDIEFISNMGVDHIRIPVDFELIEDYVEDGQEPIVEHYNYYVHWVGDSDYENEAQKSYISNDGNLYIVISDGKNIADYFDLETINDTEYMDFKFEMYNIGNGNGIEE